MLFKHPYKSISVFKTQSIIQVSPSCSAPTLLPELVLPDNVTETSNQIYAISHKQAAQRLTPDTLSHAEFKVTD